jgi:hypothetical protein
MRWLATVLMLALVLVPYGQAHAQQAPPAQPACQFVLGFASLRELVGAATVGQCLEDQRFNSANGNAEQRTTGGLLVWRKADNWTAFTDGNATWLNGPQGLQRRLNTETFDWERAAGTSAAPAGAASPPPPISVSGPTVATPAPTPAENCVSLQQSAIKTRRVDIVEYGFANFLGTGGTRYLRGTIRNNCAEPRRLTLSAVVRVGTAPNSTPLAATDTAMVGLVAAGSSAEFHLPLTGTLPEGQAVTFFRWTTIPGADPGPPDCVDVGVARCLPVYPTLTDAVLELSTVPVGMALMQTAASHGVAVQRGDLAAPTAYGVYDPEARAILLDQDLDDASLWERSAVLAHELQLAADHAAGLPRVRSDDCLQREISALRRQAQVWATFWQGLERLPEPRNPLQRLLNRAAQDNWNAPDNLVLTLGETYRIECR